MAAPLIDPLPQVSGRLWRLLGRQGVAQIIIKKLTVTYIFIHFTLSSPTHNGFTHFKLTLNGSRVIFNVRIITLLMISVRIVAVNLPTNGKGYSNSMDGE